MSADLYRGVPARVRVTIYDASSVDADGGARCVAVDVPPKDIQTVCSRYVGHMDAAALVDAESPEFSSAG